MLLCQAGTKWRPRMDLRHQPPESESGALPLSYRAKTKTCSREDLHLEPPPSQGGMQSSYTSGAVEWWLRSESRRTLLVFSEALISLSYAAVVPPRGIAPRSLAYRARALLLSYRGMKVVARRGNAPRSAGCGPAAFLLSYQAKKVAPALGNAPRFAD